MDRFLLQVSADRGYADIMNNRCYANPSYRKRPRNKDHGKVKPEDELFVYCTASVPDCGKSLAFSVIVKEVSADNVSCGTEKPHRFPFRLSFKAIRILVAQDELPDVFSKCGAQRFNIARLGSPASQQVLRLVGQSLV